MEWVQYNNLFHLQSVSWHLQIKLSSTKMACFFFPFYIFYWLIALQIEAFQRSGIQLENGNLERLFIMWCSHDYNLHQLEFH